jgi:heat shock protein HslJ
MRFVRPATCLFAALLGGCAAAPRPAPVSLDVHGAWVIEQARSAPLLDKRRARLVLGRDGRLSGHGSCNAMSAAFTLAGERIGIGPIATTRMACGELLREQEDRVLTALELAATARVRPDGLLELRDAEGRGVLRATRVPE